MITKNVKRCGINYKGYESCLGYNNVKDDLLEYKCLCCDSNFRKRIDKSLKKNLIIYTNVS